MPNASAPTIKLFVLGDARIETYNATIEPSSEVVFAAALYLLLMRDAPVTRSTLQNLLWPTVERASAAHRLRQSLLKLRKLGLPIMPDGQYRLGVSANSVWVDCDELLNEGLVNSASDNPRSLVLLSGYEPRFSEPYLDWLDEKKRQLNGLLCRIMLPVIGQQRVEGRWNQVEFNALRLLAFAPYNEEATLALAEAHAMRGSKWEAQRILDRFMADVGSTSPELKLQASLMRRRIAESAPSAGQSVSGESPLVGRGPVMTMLGDILSRVRSGNGRACVVFGGAGIGKSRLMSEFGLFAALQGVVTQRVQCRSSDLRRPLSVFVDLVPLLQSMRGAIGCSPDTFAYLDKLTRHKLGESSGSSSEGDPQFVYARIERALFDLIEAVSDEKPLVILFEDVHWIDDLSQKVLMHLVEWSADHPVFFAFTSRTRPVWWPASADKAIAIPLPPLDIVSAADLIRSIVTQHTRDIDETSLEWCVRIAEGNPFFLEELAKQWLETGSANSLPASLTSVLEQRISRLSEDSLQLLQTCAVLENHATLERVESSLGLAPHALLKAMNDLAAAGMLTSHRSDSEGRGAYTLLPRHELLATASLARLAEQARVFLHRRVATILEAEVVNNASTAVLWDCAKNWQLAGDSPRAFALARSCGLHLMAVGLPVSAADAFEKAFNYCSTSVDTLALLTDQAKAYEQSSSWAAIPKIETAARSILSQIEPNRGHHDELELRSLRALWKTGQSENTLARVLQCLDCCDALPEHRINAGAIALMLQDVLGLQQDMPKVHRIIEALAADVTENTAGILEARIVYHTLCGSLNKAIETADMLIGLQRSKDDQGDLFRYLCNASVTYRTAGHFAHAKESLDEAAKLATSHRLPGCFARSKAMLGHLNLEQGDLCGAQQAYRDLVSRFEIHDDIYVNLDIASLGTRLAILDQDYVRAAGCYKRPISEIVRDPVGQRRTYALALHVAIQLLGRQRVSAKVLENLEAAHVLSRRCVAQAFSAYVLYAALIKADQISRAMRLLTDYHKTYRREPWLPKILFGQVMEGAGVSSTTHLDLLS